MTRFAPVPENPAPSARARTAAAAQPQPIQLNLQPIPRWLQAQAGSGGAALAAESFAAGAALLALDQIIRAAPPWLGALRMRQALAAAALSARAAGYRADEPALRDAHHLTRAGDDPGPAGLLHRAWREFSRRPTRVSPAILENLAQTLGVAAPVALIERSLDEVAAPEFGDPVAAAAAAGSRLIAAIGQKDPGAAKILGWMVADLALARRLGWPIATPLFGATAPHLSAGRSADAENYAKIGRAARAACAQARDLERRAARLLALAPKLRSKGADHAIAALLADDVTAAAALADSGATALGSDRAARRLLERLVAQGALRETTDRPTFRLYGL